MYEHLIVACEKNTVFINNLLLLFYYDEELQQHTFSCACASTIFINHFRYIKIHTWLLRLGEIKQKESPHGSGMNISFLLFDPPGPQSEIRILIYQKWPIV